jgi:hypothetical protein
MNSTEVSSLAAHNTPLHQKGTDGGEAERKERQCGVTGKKWDEWVDRSNNEGENVCDIAGDECGDQGGIQGDKICNEESCDRCGE